MSALGACAAPQQVEQPDRSELVYPPPPETPRYYFERTIWGSNDVIEETRTDRLRRFATGESARGQGFAKPFGVAAFEGRIYVSDTVSRQVHVLDFPRRRYYQIGRKGVGRLSKPLGMAVAGTGMVYVCDGSARRINIYDLEGNFIDAIVLEGKVDNPSGLAISPDGETLCVVDTGRVRNESHGLMLMTRDGGVVWRKAKRGTAPGEFNLPLAVAFDAKGNIYALDTGNFRVQVFDGDGKFLNEFGDAGRFPGQFGHPKGIAVSHDGRIYVTDTSFGLFQVFDPDGQILMSVGRRDEAGGSGQFLLPAGIAVDVDHRIYVADQFFRKVEVFRPAETAEDWPYGQPIEI